MVSLAGKLYYNYFILFFYILEIDVRGKTRYGNYGSRYGS
jgi:hypothetical protein